MAVDYSGLSGFDPSGKLRLAPNDPDAAYLMQKYPGRYIITSPEQAAPYLAQLMAQGNPTTAEGVQRQALNQGVVVPDSWPVLSAAADKGAAVVMMAQNAAVQPGPGQGFNPTQLAAGVATLHAYAQTVYGSINLGNFRYSSVALENGPTGIRPGTMERIVVPGWVARQRGFPT